MGHTVKKNYRSGRHIIGMPTSAPKSGPASALSWTANPAPPTWKAHMSLDAAHALCSPCIGRCMHARALGYVHVTQVIQSRCQKAI